MAKGMNIAELKYHLLSGSTFYNVSALLYHNNFRVSTPHLLKLLYVLFATLLLTPFQLFEVWAYQRRIAKTPLVKDPVFIIGHWRSGTTFLHNLLAQDDQFIYPDTYQCFLPGAFLTGKGFLKAIHKRTLPSVRPMDNVAMNAAFPQEEEFAISSLSCDSYYQCMFFPEQMLGLFDAYALMKSPRSKQWREQYLFFLKKVSYAKNGKRLILKNPVNTVRITSLLELFPNARFIYLYRNREHVLRSTYKLYDDLFRINAFHDIPASVLRNNISTIYTKTMRTYAIQKQSVNGGRLIEISYEALVREPLAVIHKIYQGLAIDGFDAASKSFQEYISKQATYVCNSYEE